MIGQKQLTRFFSQMRYLPHFIIVLGPKGSGRKTLVEEIFRGKGISTQLSGAKTEDLRSLVETAQTQGIESAYILDAQDFTFSSAQVLLKITEEAPKNVYFVITGTNRSLIAQTLLSRALVVEMAPYSVEEREEYGKVIKNIYPLMSVDVWREIIEYSLTPGMMLELAIKYSSGNNIIGLAKQIGESIFEVSTANAFKITTRILNKENEDYPVDLLLTICLMVFGKHMRTEKPELYSKSIKITQQIISLNETTGLNKRMLIDRWLIEIERAVEGV